MKKLKAKGNAWKKYKRNKNVKNKKKFTKLRIKIKKYIANSRKFYLEKIEKNIIINPSTFWDYVKLTKSNNKSKKMLIIDDVEILDSGEVADRFADYFRRVYGPNAQNFDNKIMDCEYNSSNIDRSLLDDIIKAFKKLKNKNPQEKIK